jgi:cell division septation protein DedD
MMHQQRRLYSRKTLNPLPYVSLPSGNGGIVLDVSEQGLCFRAVAPVKQSGPIHFSFSAHSKLIEGVADLVWTDRAKKTGGLRFTQLSEDAREQIRGWPNELDLRLSVGQGFMLQIPASGDSSSTGALRRSRLDETLYLASLWSKRFESTFLEFLYSVQKVGMAGASALQLKGRFQESQLRFISTIPVIILVIIVSTLFFHFQRRTGSKMLTEFGTRNGGEVHPQAVIQTPVPNILLDRPGDSRASDEKSKVDDAKELISPQPAQATTPVIANRNAIPPPPQPPLANVRILAHLDSSAKLVVQVAALTHETDAQKLANTLRHKNFEAFVGTLPMDRLYRVMVGPYPNEESARVAVEELRKAGVDSFVRRQSGVVLAESSKVKAP